MLRFGPSIGQVARRVAIGAGATGVVGGAAVTAYSFSEQGLGFRRELQFWGVISPVIIDYWWNASSSSPYVKLRRMVSSEKPTETTAEDPENEQKARDTKYADLHARNAPRVFQMILQLGGLYVKLGQVLSVTALPIPEPYRILFRTLQSNVPGHEEFESVVKPTLEKQLGRPLEELFESIDEEPCGAASIGQAHKAVLKGSNEKVIVKVQYPDASIQIPADIQCVGDFMQLCVYFGLVDEDAAKLSFEEFSRQFLAELDYDQERRNLEQVYESSLDPSAPYIHRGVVLPKVYPELCTRQVLTMSYLPGPKFEEEAKRQLAVLGVRTNRRMRDIVQDQGEGDMTKEGTPVNQKKSEQWQQRIFKFVNTWVGVDSVLSVVRVTKRIFLLSKVAVVSGIRAASKLSIVPSSLEDWARDNEDGALHIARLDWIHEAVYALLDVHGYQILNQGLFNADPHPGNLLIVQDDADIDASGLFHAKIGLIDYGQCKRLSSEERVRVAKLIMSVADEASDDTIASHFRNLGIQTKNDSTEFLAEFARLMFGSFKPKHLSSNWHKTLHEQDRVLYFPNELSMVYRTSLLLRGLAMSLQLNVSVGEQWRKHAKYAIEQHEERLKA